MCSSLEKKRLVWTKRQEGRLLELGAGASELMAEHDSAEQRVLAFQRIEKRLAGRQKELLNDFLQKERTTRLSRLEQRLADALQKAGFARVSTPTVITASALAKMSVTSDHPLSRQVYWLDRQHCLRPMLAPSLYSLLQDLSRVSDQPVRIFEIGSCFRKDSRGANHSLEFTMLNLVELRTPQDQTKKRLLELGELVVKAAGLDDCQYSQEDSTVYGYTVDILAGNHDLEIASGATGPHALDGAWKIIDPWVGWGFGLERMLMVREKSDSIGRWQRSLKYLDGINLKV